MYTKIVVRRCWVYHVTNQTAVKSLFSINKSEGDLIIIESKF